MRKIPLYLAPALAVLVVLAILLRNSQTSERPEPQAPGSPDAAIIDNSRGGDPETPGTRRGKPPAARKDSPSAGSRTAHAHPNSRSPADSPPLSSGVEPFQTSVTPYTLPRTKAKVDRPGTGTISGIVKVSVPPQKDPNIDLSKYPDVARLYPGGMGSERITVDSKNRIQWAMVRVREGLPPLTPDLPSPRPYLTFSKYRYQPRLVGLRSGTMLGIINGDPVDHHYQLNDTVGAVSHHAVIRPKEKTGVQFAPAREFVQFSCRFHPWEIAWVGVMSHPYYSVSGAGGKYAIANLPPGQYTLEAWHEAYRPVTRRVIVEPDQVATLELVLDQK